VVEKGQIVTKKDRALELTSVFHKYPPRRRALRVAVKVVDIFGNDTITMETRI
jgi:hypothetical protein